MATVLLTFLVSLAAYLGYIVAKYIYLNIVGPWKNCPPGPPVVPVIGAGFVFKYDRQHGFESPAQLIHRLCKKYGNVMRMQMGSDNYVFLNGLEEIKMFSSLECTTGRPYNATLLEMYSDGQPLGFGIGVGGERWREQRKFAARVLNELSEGTKGMDDKIMHEVRFTIDDIKQRAFGSAKARTNDKDNVLDRVDKYFDLPDLNVIWGLVAATRFEFEDPKIEVQFGCLRSFLHEQFAGPLTAIQWLKKIPPFKGIYLNIRDSMRLFRKILSEVIQQQEATFVSGQPRGYIDRFLQEKIENKRGKFFTDNDLIINCQDLFIAGSETAASTLSFSILHLILRPDIQTKIQQEIDEHVGREREVTIEDRANLIFTEATLMEVRRYSTPFPITPPRISDRDLTIGGFTIPAGTTVQMNLFSVLRGEQYWDQPDEFNPSRFINEKNELVIPDAFIPFGFGKRRCLGEKLASISNFLFLANLLQVFSFRRVEGEIPSLRPVGGLTFGPAPFHVKVFLRQ